MGPVRRVQDLIPPVPQPEQGGEHQEDGLPGVGLPDRLDGPQVVGHQQEDPQDEEPPHLNTIKGLFQYVRKSLERKVLF